MPIGFRILPRPAMVSLEVAARFRDLPVANISDSMSRLTAGGPRLRPMHAGGPMSGPALTVKTRPGDNLMVHKALDLAQPGDVLVVDAGGELANAIIGELMLAQAEERKLGGIVIHGSIRDSVALRAGSLPVYAAGITHRGPYKDGPGEIFVPVSFDGMVVMPGDLMVGDEDGLLCIPQAEVEAVYAATKKKNDAEAATMAAIRAGTSDRAWVDATLRRLGCEGLD